MNNEMRNLVLFSLFFLINGCLRKDITPQKQAASRELTRITQLQVIEDLEKLLDEEIQEHEVHNILVILDFNYTLLHPIDPALHRKSTEKHKTIFRKLTKSISKLEKNLLLNRVSRIDTQELVSKKAPALIQMFQERGVCFIVCTGSLTKIRGKESRADVIEDLLKRHDIVLNREYFSFTDVTFDEFKEHLGAWPAYKNGIITTNRENKGLVLSSFLKKCTQKPELVVFVDDDRRKVNDVLKITNDFEDVKFIVCEYKESENAKVPRVSKKEFIDFWSKKITEIKSLNLDTD